MKGAHDHEVFPACYPFDPCVRPASQAPAAIRTADSRTIQTGQSRERFNYEKLFFDIFMILIYAYASEAARVNIERVNKHMAKTIGRKYWRFHFTSVARTY